MNWAQTYRIQNWPSSRLKESTCFPANFEFCTFEPFPPCYAERGHVSAL